TRARRARQRLMRNAFVSGAGSSSRAPRSRAGAKLVRRASLAAGPPAIVWSLGNALAPDAPPLPIAPRPPDPRGVRAGRCARRLLVQAVGDARAHAAALGGLRVRGPGGGDRSRDRRPARRLARRRGHRLAAAVRAVEGPRRLLVGPDRGEPAGRAPAPAAG